MNALKKQIYRNGRGKKRPPWQKKKSPQKDRTQLQTHNLPTDDEENTDGKRKKNYYFQISRGLLFEELKGCSKGIRTGDLLYVGQYILKDSKKGSKKFAISWIH